MKSFFLLAFSLSLAGLLGGCATPAQRTETSAPPNFIELHQALSISTIHFPTGLYSLDYEDAHGYYYRAPRALSKHSFIGPEPVRGGFFLSKNDRSTVRGYVVWAGGWTKIGHVSPSAVAFRD